MDEDFQKAFNAAGRNLPLGLPHALNEYAIFLRHLTTMEKHLQEIGVAFNAEKFAEKPETVVFSTPFGKLRMQRRLVVDEGHVAVVVVFVEDEIQAPVTDQSTLWALRLGWNSPWIDSAGNKISKEFASDETSPRAAFNAVHNALARKLALDTKQWSYKGWQGLNLT